jgi:hypothetical protein
MPVLMFLRQYGLREYAITLTVAALVGLGVAVLLNSASGGGAETPSELTLRAKPQAAPSAERVAAVTPLRKPRAAKPVSTSHKPVRKQRVRQRSAPAPAPKPAAAPAPADHLVASNTPEPQQTYTPPPAPKPAPVVSKPAPKPAPKPVGSPQFDDSG